MGALIATLDASDRPALSPETLLRMAAAEPGRGVLEFVETPLGCLGIQRFADEAFLVRDGHHYLAFHGFPAWSADAPSRFRASPATPARVLECLIEQGPAAFAWLNAEFTALHVDAERRCLRGASHFSGIKSLHWFRAGARLLLASAPRQIHAAGLCAVRLDEQAIAAWRSTQLIPAGRSLFENVLRVDPGHAVMFEASSGAGWLARSEQVFALPEVDPVLSRLPLGELVGLIGAELDRATAALLLARPCVLQVSGGLDSPNVLASALRMARSAGITAPTACSIAFPGHTCDEQAQVHTLARALNTEIRFSNHDAEVFADAAAWVLEHSDYPAMETTHFMLAAARQFGVSRTCLASGLGGDEWFSFDPTAILSSPWAGWLRQVPDMAGWSRRTAARGAHRRALLPWLRPARALLCRLGRPASLQAWLSMRSPHPVMTMLGQCAHSTWRLALEQALAAAEIELVSPFNCADLVKLAARIDPLRFCAHGATKGLLLELAHQRISPLVAQNARKVIFDDLCSPLLHRNGQPWLQRIAGEKARHDRGEMSR